MFAQTVAPIAIITEAIKSYATSKPEYFRILKKKCSPGNHHHEVSPGPLIDITDSSEEDPATHSNKTSQPMCYKQSLSHVGRTGRRCQRGVLERRRPGSLQEDMNPRRQDPSAISPRGSRDDLPRMVIRKWSNLGACAFNFAFTLPRRPQQHWTHSVNYSQRLIVAQRRARNEADQSVQIYSAEQTMNS